MTAGWLGAAIDVVVLIIEAAGALVIVVGAVLATFRFVQAGVRRHDASVCTSIRLSLGRFLTLGLEFQLAADILRTAIAPSLEEIGQLAAIATIRTALNYFLRREIMEEQRQIQQRSGADPVTGGSPTR